MHFAFVFTDPSFYTFIEAFTVNFYFIFLRLIFYFIFTLLINLLPTNLLLTKLLIFFQFLDLLPNLATLL